MAMHTISIEQFLSIQPHTVVFDVRSEGEFEHAHIPGAYSLPLFNNAERAIVGTAYKQEGKQPAVKLGLDFFGNKMSRMVEEAEQHLHSLGKPMNEPVVVHCWRGGMRSASVAWLLDLYGFNVYQLVGGYKAYRRWALQQFEHKYAFTIIGGYTGSGKTGILHELHKKGMKMIDLEKLAHHKGSSFGALGETPQPSQEMFENELALNLFHQSVGGEEIFLEDESQWVGRTLIPNPIWKQMRNSRIIFIEIPFGERLKQILNGYGKFDKEELMACVVRIQKRLGGLETKNAIRFLTEEDIEAAFAILLAYYDKLYKKGLFHRDNIDKLLTRVACNTVDAVQNLQLVLVARDSVPE